MERTRRGRFDRTNKKREGGVPDAQETETSEAKRQKLVQELVEPNATNAERKQSLGSQKSLCPTTGAVHRTAGPLSKAPKDESEVKQPSSQTKKPWRPSNRARIGKKPFRSLPTQKGRAPKKDELAEEEVNERK